LASRASRSAPRSNSASRCSRSATPEQLAAAIEREEVARLKKIPGVGQKTAERLALELRDKFDKAGIRSAARLPAAGRPGPGGADAGTVAQIASALTNLGYRAQEAERAAAQVVEAASGSQPGVAELVKRALRQLAE
jgi:Holliday junction DNA helicase RuvA